MSLYWTLKGVVPRDAQSRLPRQHCQLLLIIGVSPVHAAQPDQDGRPSALGGGTRGRRLSRAVGVNCQLCPPSLVVARNSSWCRLLSALLMSGLPLTGSALVER